jgi:hypothetical protein
VDNTPEPGDNLGNTPNTPNGPTVCDRPVTTLGRMTGQVAPQGPRLLRPVQVQRLLNVGRTTVHDWEAAGRLIASRTLGGHRRYPADQPALLAALEAQETAR